MDPKNYCRVCDKTLARREGYLHHLKRFHTKALEIFAEEEASKMQHKPPPPDEDDSSFHCRSCQKTFANKGKFRAHLAKSHKLKLKPILTPKLAKPGLLPDTDDSDFYCRVCERHYSSKRKYRKHLRTTHNLELVPLRKINTTAIVSLSKPGLIPNKDDPNFYCRVCERHYSCQNLYRKHLRRTHKLQLVPLRDIKAAEAAKANCGAMYNGALPQTQQSSTLSCSICKKTFITTISLNYHVCTSDSETSPAELTQQSHVNTTTSPTEEDLVPDEDDPNFYCRSCGTSSTNKHTYHTHLRVVHQIDISDSSIMEPPEMMPDEYDPNFYCNVCDRTHGNRENFHGHLRTKHKMKLNPIQKITRGIRHPELVPDEDDPELYCCACEKSYYNRGSYRNHLVNIHEMTLKPIIRELKRHYRIRKPTLQPDVDDPTFFCRACERNYATSCGYRSHLRKVHEMKLESRRNRGRCAFTVASGNSNKRRSNGYCSNRSLRSPMIFE